MHVRQKYTAMKHWATTEIYQLMKISSCFCWVSEMHVNGGLN